MSNIDNEVLTDKFEKEVQSFFRWATKSEYHLKDNDSPVEWSIELLNNITFSEPCRNKLEVLIKSVMQNYTVYYNETIEDDAKLISKNFKQSPVEKSPKKLAKEKKEKIIKKPKKKIDTKLTNKQLLYKIKITEDTEINNIRINNTDKIKITEDTEINNIRINKDLNTDKTNYVDTLDYWTKDLIRIFGEPEKNKSNDNREYIYEWKIQVNDEIYSIHDWHTECIEDFENITWHLASNETNKNNVDLLIKYINDIVKYEDIILDFGNLSVNQ